MNRHFLLLLSLLCSLYARDAKFELGLGVASLYYPNYVGSNSTRILTLPVPHIRYRGEYFKIDENGITGKLFGVDGLRLELSVSGSLPASSDADGVRKDMPNLDLTGEIGGRFVYVLYAKGVSLLELELPMRAVLSTDFSSVSYRGLLSNPQLKYSLRYKELVWTLRTGVVYADADYNNYFYGVKEEYVTPTRSFYEAKSGCGGFRNRIGVTYKKGNWWAGAFVAHYDIRGATFKDSPLIERHDALYTGASLTYIFYTLE